MSEPQHRFQMPPQHRRRNQLGDLRRFVPTRFDLVQRVAAASSCAPAFPYRVRFVPLRDPRVEIPAVVIDALAVIGEPRHQRLHIAQR